MSEIVERVARALAKRAWIRTDAADSAFAAQKYPGGVEQYQTEQWSLYEADARDAIEAMRNPSDDILRAAKIEDDDGMTPLVSNWEYFREQLSAMIDEALK